jgi:uncharacterized protein (DUF934 family)
MAKPILRLIRNGVLEANLWQLDDNTSLTLPPDSAHWMITLESWKANQDALPLRQYPVAIFIPSSTELNDFFPQGGTDINTLSIALIAIDFPAYTDGRGFSLAQILRTQYGWRGELKAVGDVLIDTIHYLARCGFDSFLVKEGHDPELALKSFETFTVHYQKSYLKPGIENSK